MNKLGYAFARLPKSLWVSWRLVLKHNLPLCTANAKELAEKQVAMTNYVAAIINRYHIPDNQANMGFEIAVAHGLNTNYQLMCALREPTRIITDEEYYSRKAEYNKRRITGE